MQKTNRIMSISEVLSRGVEQVLPSKESLQAALENRKIRVYLGIDPTGNLLTLGHSVVLRKLQQIASLGHEVILLIGNGTVKIGDPTGKDAARPELTDAQIAENFVTWKAQASKVIDFDLITIKHNGDWLDKLSFSEIVKIMAKTTVQQLMERDMFQDRLAQGKPIHAHELMYPLLQGYDSVVMNVDLEIGGTDQTFNMLMGRTMQKTYNNKEKWVLSTPLIPGTDGRKMSKSLNNFIALTAEPNEMFGGIMSITDDLIFQYFEVLTDVDLTLIEEMKHAVAAGENPMQFKKQLAFTITEQYHDTQAAEAAAEHFEKTVQQRQIPTELPTIKLQGQTVTALTLVTECLPELSNSEARRLLSQSSVELLPALIKPTDPNEELQVAELDIVRIGKRKYFKIVNK